MTMSAGGSAIATAAVFSAAAIAEAIRAMPD